MKVIFSGSLLENAQALPIIVPSVNQDPTENQQNLLVWPPNSLVSDLNCITLNMNLCKKSDSYNNLASTGRVKDQGSAFGGCDCEIANEHEEDQHSFTISTLSL